MPSDRSSMPIWHCHWEERRKIYINYIELKYETAKIWKMRK